MKNTNGSWIQVSLTNVLININLCETPATVVMYQLTNFQKYIKTNIR